MTSAPPPVPASDDRLRTDGVWVALHPPHDEALGLIGDAREIADRLQLPVRVMAFETGENPDLERVERWVHHGADDVLALAGVIEDQASEVAAAADLWRGRPPRIVLTAADRRGRAWSARLAARLQWALISPALFVHVKRDRLIATVLDVFGQRARQCELPTDAPAIVAIRPGVPQPLPKDLSRIGSVRVMRFDRSGSPRARAVRVPADPVTADIRHLQRLIAGGRGVGSAAGFDRLRRIGAKLGAGVAASRMAVDLGWIEHARQVGQTGKSVRPDLYLACGISGATHHLEGMSDSRCIIAINTDPKAPLMQRAHLAIVGDLHEILEHFERELEQAD